MAGTQTTFVRNGFERVTMLITTGHVDRWDQFIAAPAALSTGGLVVFSLWGYLQAPTKRPVDLVHFVAVLAVVPLFFAVIFWLFTSAPLTLAFEASDRSRKNESADDASNPARQYRSLIG